MCSTVEWKHVSLLRDLKHPILGACRQTLEKVNLLGDLQQLAVDAFTRICWT